MGQLRRMLEHPFTQALAVYAAFMGPRREVWGAMTRVPASVYRGDCILVRALETQHVLVTMVGLLVLALACSRWRWADLWSSSSSSSSSSWEQAGTARAFRVSLSVIILAQVWLVVGAPYNLVADRAWGLDRGLALVLGGLALWRPSFWPLLTALALVFAGQEDTPLPGLNWTERRVFLDVQLAFAGFLLVRRLIRAAAPAYLFVVLLIIGGAYLWPGVNKLLIGPHLWSWLVDDDLGNLFISCWATGFPPVIDVETAQGIARFLGSASVVIGVATLIIELGAVTLLAHRRLTPIMLLLFVGMHLGIFASSGILFWKWIVVDVAMGALFWRHGTTIFGAWPWWQRVVGTVVIALAHWTLEPQTLGWWDTRFSRVYDLEAVVDDGSVRQLSPHDLAPYDMPFIQARIAWAVDAPTLTGTFGASAAWTTFQKLQGVDQVGLQRMLKSRKSELDVSKAKKLDALLQASATTLNKHHGRAPLWWVPSPPSHMHHQPRGGTRWQGETITAIRLRLREVFFDGQQLHTVTNKVVREVAIPALSSSSSSSSLSSPSSSPSSAWVASPLRTAMARPQQDRGSALTFRDACAATDVATIALMNDVTLHQPLQLQAFDAGYDSIWGALKPFIAAADATWVNVEGTLGCCTDGNGVEQPDPGRRFDGVVYTSGTKTGLNMHAELASQLVTLGVDVVGTANNHALDRLRGGVARSLGVLDQVGLPHTGTRLSAKEGWHVVTDVKGIKVAWLACTEWVNNKRKSEQGDVLNCTTQHEEVINLVRTLANDPAIDAVVFLPSGGIERRLAVDERLRTLAIDAAEAGATVVASYHPHHLQTWEKYVATDGREVPLVWNRGNWITFEDELEQRASTLVFVGLARDATTHKARVVGVSHLPVALRHEGERRTLVVAETAADQGPAFALAVSRFGASRLQPPTLPLETRRECQASPPSPRAIAVGELCLHDDECGPGFTCQDFVDGNSVCTAACDASCAAAGGACVTTAPWGKAVCLRRCDDGECPLAMSCAPSDGTPVCRPQATVTQGKPTKKALPGR